MEQGKEVCKTFCGPKKLIHFKSFSYGPLYCIVYSVQAAFSQNSDNHNCGRCGCYHYPKNYITNRRAFEYCEVYERYVGCKRNPPFPS